MDALTEKMAQELTIEMMDDGIWKAVAAEIGTINLIKVLALLNGDKVYIPKPDRILIPARTVLLKKECTGYNHKELANRYGLSTNYIKAICGDSLIEGQCSLFE